MKDYTDLGRMIRAELKRRALHPDADVHRLLEEFSTTPGARVLYSEGDGEVSILIPVVDGYEGPSKLEIALQKDTSDVFAVAPKQGVIEIEGVGTFTRFVVEPLRYKKRSGGDDDLSIHGEGWSPLGFDGWFYEDLRLLVDLARRDGIEVRPEVELDPRDPNWMKLDATQRGWLEQILGRVLPDVIHVSTFEDALEKADSQNSALSSAIAGIRLAIAPAAAEGAKADEGTALAARPILEKVFGAGTLDRAAPFTKEILTLAEDVLLDRGREGEASAIRLALRGEAVAPETLEAAVGRALGVGFAKSRQVGVGMIDRTIARFGKQLSFDDVEKLRDLRAELDHQSQVELLGEDLADRPLSTQATDATLRELCKQLKGRSGVGDAFVLSLASKIQGVVNAPRNRPHVIIVAGERGPGVDQVLSRALDAAGKPFTIQGNELRMDDPVGYLVGSPAGEAGAAKGRLIQDGPKQGERLVGRIDGLEMIAANLADDDARRRSERSFWGFIGQVERDGWYRGFDPDDEEAKGGARIDLGGGLLVLTTSLTPKQLAERVPEDVWEQLAVHVVEAGKSDAASVASEIGEAVRTAVIAAGSYPDAEVQLGERAQAMIRDLLGAGMKPAALSRVMIDFLVDRVSYGALEGTLSPKLRIDLHRGLTASERADVVKGWSKGEYPSLAGIGGCPFVLYDEGRFQGKATAGISAKILAERTGDRREVERLRAQIAEYQVALTSGDKDKAALLGQNEQLAEWLSHAEVRIDAGNFLNLQLTAEKKDLEHLNQLAQQTIASLQTDVEQLNERIDSLNTDLAKAKGAATKIKGQLDVALRERDEITRALRTTEAQFEQAIRGMGDDVAGRNPNDVFRQITGNAAANQGRYQRPMLEQMHLVATSKALQSAGQMAHSTNKWREISELANNYVASSRALGVPVDARVMDGFERAARLSGNGWERNLAEAWQRDVGQNSGHQGEDAGVVGHLLRQLARMGRIRL